MLTVTTAAEHYRLTTVEAVKVELNITTGEHDAWLASRIDRASAQAAQFCNRVFARETLSESIRLFDVRTAPNHSPTPILLNRFPIVSISSVTEDGTALTADQTEVDSATGLLWRLDDDGERTAWAIGKTVVAYTAGYVLPGEQSRTLPHDVEAAVNELVKAAWFARSRDPLLKADEVAGVGRQEFWVGAVGDQSPGIPDEVATLLAPYRIYSVG